MLEARKVCRKYRKVKKMRKVFLVWTFSLSKLEEVRVYILKCLYIHTILYEEHSWRRCRLKGFKAEVLNFFRRASFGVSPHLTSNRASPNLKIKHWKQNNNAFALVLLFNKMSLSCSRPPWVPFTPLQFVYPSCNAFRSWASEGLFPRGEQ